MAVTLESSGAMSLGTNATTTRSVACALLLDGTTQICMDQAAVRSLAARTSGGSSICFCDFYGKVGPPSIGDVFGGGYYTGAVSSPANYRLVVAPNATGCAQCPYKTENNVTPGALSVNDGYDNTEFLIGNATHPAANFTATRSINGFSDWYLPARNELNLLYVNKGSMPAGEGYATAFNLHWSSTTHNNPAPFCCNYAFGQCFLTGAQFNYTPLFKRSEVKVRAIRRVPL